MSYSRRNFIQHLAISSGGLVSAATLASLLNGCAIQNLKRDDSSDLISRTFSTTDQKLIARLCDIIIPATDTPGAISAGVPGLILDIVIHTFSSEKQQAFSSGLIAFQNLALLELEQSYLEASFEDQTALTHKVNLIDTVRQKTEAIDKEIVDQLFPGLEITMDDKSMLLALDFFATIKQLTIVGFFRSQIGATQVLNYDPNPGDFDGCVPLQTLGKSWAV